MTTQSNAVAIVSGLVLALVVLAALGSVTGPAAAQSASVSVTNVTVSPANPAAGETFVVTARIANAGGSEESVSLNNVYLQTPEGRSYVASDVSDLGPGQATTVSIPVTLDSPGSKTLELRVRGQAGPSVVNLNYPVPVTVQGDQSDRLSIGASVDDLGPSNRTNMHVTVGNGFDQPITGVDLRLESDDLDLPESNRVTSQVIPGNVSRFTVPVRDAEPGEYEVTARLAYSRADGERRTVTRNLTAVVTAVDEPGRIALTEMDVSREGENLVVRGSASNPGTTDVSGVIVRVAESEDVRPAGGSSDFFVGEVAASEFSSFDVAVRPETNGTLRIPLEVSYNVDGERTTRTVEVTHEVEPESDSGDSESGGSLLPIVGVLLVLGAVVFAWRRYRG